MLYDLFQSTFLQFRWRGPLTSRQIAGVMLASLIALNYAVLPPSCAVSLALIGALLNFTDWHQSV